MRRGGWILALGLLVGVAFAPTRADAAAPKGTYQWYLENNGPLGGPSVSQARDGYQLELQGNGAFYVGDKHTTASGGGTYRLLDRNGKEVKTGDWEMRGASHYEDQGQPPPPEVALDAFADYRSGTLVAPADFGKLGTSKITVYCFAGKNKDIEGFRMRLGKRSYDKIVSGNTDFIKSDDSSFPGRL